MRNRIQLIIAVLLSLISISVSAQTRNTSMTGIVTFPIKGDVNNDRMVDISDVSELISFVIGKNNTSDTDNNAQSDFETEIMLRGDMNEDNTIDISDITELVNIILGKQSIYADAVDLGLPSGTKWASWNIGAAKPEDLGDYYAWGEIEVKSEYTNDNYYSPYLSPNFTNSICGTQNDVAHVKWGGQWQMPNEDDFNELINNCSYKWITYNGVEGGMFTGPNGNSIFLPAAGCRINNVNDKDTSIGCYLSGTQTYGSIAEAFHLQINNDNAHLYQGECCHGYTIRPIVKGRNVNLSINIPILNDKVETFDVPDTKFNHSMYFYGKLGTAGTLTILRGTSPYCGGRFIIDPSKITVVAGNVTTEYEHGLSLSDFILVNINIVESIAKITLTTKDGMFVQDGITFHGSRDDIKLSVTDGEFTDCRMTWTSRDLDKDIYVFGDSYLDYWPKQAKKLGYGNALFDGFSGRSSARAYKSLVEFTSFRLPHIIIWGMGLTDNGEVDGINQTWLSYANKFIDFCEQNNIEPIFVTIPNTETRNNSYKNAWIRESGYRYVDVCKAVGADESTSWYPGLIGKDKSHPTSKGAIVIAQTFADAVPELKDVDKTN